MIWLHFTTDSTTACTKGVDESVVKAGRTRSVAGRWMGERVGARGGRVVAGRSPGHGRSAV